MGCPYCNNGEIGGEICNHCGGHGWSAPALLSVNKKDLFIEDEKNYFSMPCIGCKHRNGGAAYCMGCIHYA